MSGSRPASDKSALVRYALAVGFVAAALAIELMLGPVLTFAFFLGAVLLSAWYGGTRAGIFAVLLSVAVLTFVLKRPPFTYWTYREFLPRVITFVVASSLLLFVSHGRRKAESALMIANAELEKRAKAALVHEKRRARHRVRQARLEARLEERTRLAREIHDTLLQGFTGVSLQLLATMGRTDVAPECHQALTGVLGLAQKTLADARQAVWDMRPPALEGDDFVASLEAGVERTLHGSGIALEFAVRGSPRALDPDVETVVFRVAMEATTNALKHSDAQNVRVVLSFRPRSVRLVVADNGRGFVVEPGLHAYAGRWGLLGMRERASQLRGDLSIKSTPGEGTKVVLRVPSRPRSALPNQGIAEVSRNPVV